MSRIVENITEQKEGDAMLADSEDRLRQALDAGGIARFDIDLACGKICGSRGMARLLGLALQALPEDLEIFKARIHPDDRERVHGEFDTALDGKAEFRSEFRVCWDDGSVHWLEVVGGVVCDAGGQPVGMSGVLMDVTQHKRVQAELAEANRRLQETLNELQAAENRLVQQERLRAMARMATGLAHSLSNAMTPVLGFSEMLLHSPELKDAPDSVKELAQTIHARSLAAADEVKRLRGFLRYRDTRELEHPPDDWSDRLLEYGTLPPPPPPLRILLVDDDLVVRHTISRMLSSDGHIVTTAVNGNEGFQVFARSENAEVSAERFDVVITDRLMPELDGLQLAMAIKSLAPWTPVILLTGYTDYTEPEDENPPAVEQMLYKPVTLAQLRGALAKVTATPERRAQ